MTILWFEYNFSLKWGLCFTTGRTRLHAFSEACDYALILFVRMFYNIICHLVSSWFTGKFDIFPLISLSDIVSINYRSVWRHIMTFNTDKMKSVHSEGLDIHYNYYSRSSYQTRCERCRNDCLDLQNWRYSIYMSCTNNYEKDRYYHIKQ